MSKFTISPEDQVEIDWLNQQKEQIDDSTGKAVSWDKLGLALGINAKTLGLIGSGNYAAPVNKFAATIRLYREQQGRRAVYKQGVIKHPGWIDLPTAQRYWTLLSIAHGGEMVMICDESGRGKTFAAEEYQKRGGANVFLVTFNETSNRFGSMVGQVLEAVGGQRRNSTVWMSEQIVTRLKGAKALLIVDEAGCADKQGLEQFRHWQKATGCGVALIGNRDLQQKIEGAKESFAFARLNSRIYVRLPPNMSLDADIPLYLKAYGIEDEAVCRMLTRIGLNVRSGGLREIDMTLKLASKLAAANNRPINANHIVAAQESRGLRADGTPL
jgi:DNA transposition AAA+ family ATPase